MGVAISGGNNDERQQGREETKRLSALGPTVAFTSFGRSRALSEQRLLGKLSAQREVARLVGAHWAVCLGRIQSAQSGTRRHRSAWYPLVAFIDQTRERYGSYELGYIARGVQFDHLNLNVS